MTSSVYAIGRNCYKEFGASDAIGFSQTRSLKRLDGDMNDNYAIMHILSGEDTSIYTDGNQNIWTAGYNHNGSCATNYFGNISGDAFHKMTYFHENNITIKKISTNIRSRSVFWLTDTNQVYGNGKNADNQLGIDGNEDQCKPILIPILKDVIDIQSAQFYTLALCSNISPNTSIIIQFWCRMLKIEVPHDVMNVVVVHYNSNKVLSVGHCTHGGHGHKNLDSQPVTEWTEIEGLKDKNIEQIRVGESSSFFLDSAGTVWCCGTNEQGQLGLGHKRNMNEITAIDYFVTNKVKIKSIECGRYFTIMIDYDGRVWFTGRVEYEYGTEAQEPQVVPKEMYMFREGVVEMVRCGWHHVVVKYDGKYYMWGDNDYNQCLVFGEGFEMIKEARLVDLGGKVVKDIFVGYDNTKLMIADQ